MEEKTREYDPRIKLKDVSDEWICKSVHYFRGNLTKAAHALGISRATIYRKMDETKKADHVRL